MMKKERLKSALLLLPCCLTVLQCACTPSAPTGSDPTPAAPTVLETGGALKDARYTETEFYFTTKDDTECRLTLDGKNGWRLQALDPDVRGKGYTAFHDLGAAQALSKYLGEDYNQTPSPFTVTTVDGIVTLRAGSIDSYVTIDLGGNFDLSFHHKSGGVLMNVSYLSAFGKTVTMRGDLTPDEAVVGGGQRFDTVNRRGTSLTLYTYDAYNADGGKGTYVAIPLFANTRGGGMFINRYETMTAEFDRTNPNEWSVKLQNDLMDAYFYADGSISDVLQSYTDLAGHATLPEEWGQGVLVCRRSPDFLTLDGRQKVYASLEEIPDYKSLYADNKKTTLATDAVLENGQYLFNKSGNRQYYYLDGQFILTTKNGNPGGYGVREVVEGLIGAGMTPTAVILEPFSWASVSASPIRYQELKDIVDWLDTLSIKTMLYMSVGNPAKDAAGYLDSYSLTATINGQKTNKIPRLQKTANPDAANTNAQTYLDITNPHAVKWYMDSLWSKLINLGVDGCKIDFCEVLPNEGVYTNGTSIQYDFYDKSVFDGEGDTLHHAYSSYFISLFYKSMLEQKAEKNLDDGFVLLSRGGGIGSQRNPYMWAGDQTRTEPNLKTQLTAILTSGVSGLPFMTYDMAGYAYSKGGEYFKEGMVEQESEIFIRSIQYTAFTSVIQTHGDVRHMYELSEEAQRISASYTSIHNALLPYIRTLSQIACDTGMPMVRHLILHAPTDAHVYAIDDEFMLGDALLIAPILSTDTTAREVYLPAGTWVDLISGETHTVGAEGKTLSLTLTREQIPVFLNAASADAQSLLPVFNGAVWQAINGGNAITLG